MGKHSHATLDRDRAFHVEEMSDLLMQGKEILNNAIDINAEMDKSISRISDINREIDWKYRVHALEQDITYLSGRIKKDIYQNAIDFMDTILNKLMEDIPSYDESMSREVKKIQEALRSVNNKVDELKELLDTVDVGWGYKEFSQSLEDIRVGWKMTAGDLREVLKEIEEEMLGMGATGTPYSDDPVNLSTGNFVYDHEDMKISGEIPLFFHRYYNAKSRRKGSLGRCFQHNYESCLEINEEKVTVSMGDGQKKTFKRLENGTYQGVYSAMEILEKEAGGDQGKCWILTKPIGERTVYHETGRMIRQENRHGRGISFFYNEKGQLEKAETDNAAYLTYSYNEEGMLASVADHTGRKTKLSYAKGKLATVKVPSGSVYTYCYAKNGRMEEAVNSRGYIAVRNIYDDKRRVTRQEFPDGGHMEFRYDDEKKQVILTERNGSKMTYVHDSKYRNTDILYGDGTKEHFGYNSKNQRILHTDRNGNTTRMVYDNRGNLTQVINALGEKINLTYDMHNNLINIKINGIERQKNCFDGKGNLLESRDALSRKIRFTYSATGLPEKVIQPDGSTICIGYDEKGNIVSLTDATGGKTLYVYDGLNRVIQTIDPNGNPMAFTYDKADNILSLINAVGDVCSFTYNESGKVAEIKDFDGSVVKRSYNVLNRPEELTDQLGRTTRIQYDAMWNPSCVILPDGGEMHYNYDGNNRLESIADAAGNMVSYTYDGNGNRISERDQLGNTIRFTYNAAGHLVHVQGEDGAEMSYVYNTEGLMTEAEDALGNKVFLEYDEAGQLVKESDTTGNCREYTYTLLGRVESATDEAGRKTSYTYLPGGLLSGISYSDRTKENYTYDAAGNVKTHTDRNGFRVTYGYDCLGRVTSIEGSGGERKEYTYDAVGNVIKVTDVYGHTTRYEYSLTGQLIKVTDALGNETEYRYDPCDRLVEIRQYGDRTEGAIFGKDKEIRYAEEMNRDNRVCQITRCQRNLLGQIEAVTDALGNTERYTYDAKGQLIEKLDKEGYLTKYGYTAQGDVNRIAYADGREVKYSYNPLRHLEEMEDWLGITKIKTDTMGRALKVQYPDGKEVSYSYGKSGERIGIIYPDGEKTVYTYDSALRLSGLSDRNGTITYGYDGTGLLARKIFPNGMETSYAYDMEGRLAELTHRDREGILDRYSYQYDLMGNRTVIEKQRRGLDEESGIYTYGHDALGRLCTVAKDGQKLRDYKYDAFGNRSLLKEGGRETTYIYNALNQLVSRSDAVNEETYSYDKRGNLSLIMENGALKNRYTYGTLNRLEQAVSGKGEMASYLYNGLGHRVGKKVRSGTTIQYTVDLTKNYNNLLQKEEENNIQNYLWDGDVVGMRTAAGAPVERREGRLERSVISHYYFQDELGSSIRLLGESGELEESYGYDEFGQDLYGNQGVLQPFGYTGYQADRITGTCYAQAREYRTELGRFAAADIVKGAMTMPFTLNEYGYCWNAPLLLVDLDGRFPSFRKIERDIKRELSSLEETVNRFYNENKEVIDTVGKILITVLTVAAVVMIGVMAAIAIEGALPPAVAIGVGGTILLGGVPTGITGGLSNMMTGGSFLNGFCGGYVNGCITKVGRITGKMLFGNFLGGFTGNMITESFNNLDITEPKEQKNQTEIFIDSMLAGFTQAAINKYLSLDSLRKKSDLKKGSLGYYIAKFFENDAHFFISDSVSVLGSWFTNQIFGNTSIQKNGEEFSGKE